MHFLGALHLAALRGPVSDVLARALLAQIEKDFKREVDPNWRVRGLRSQTFDAEGVKVRKHALIDDGVLTFS